jgi:hypothetical protein
MKITPDIHPEQRREQRGWFFGVKVSLTLSELRALWRRWVRKDVIAAAILPLVAVTIGLATVVYHFTLVMLFLNHLTR